MLQLSLNVEVAKLENEKAAFVYKNNLHHRSDTMDLAECMCNTIRSPYKFSMTPPYKEVETTQMNSTIFFTRTLTEKLLHALKPRKLFSTSGSMSKPVI